MEVVYPGYIEMSTDDTSVASMHLLLYYTYIYYHIYITMIPYYIVKSDIHVYIYRSNNVVQFIIICHQFIVGEEITFQIFTTFSLNKVLKRIGYRFQIPNFESSLSSSH